MEHLNEDETPKDIDALYTVTNPNTGETRDVSDKQWKDEGLEAKGFTKTKSATMKRRSQGKTRSSKSRK